MCEIDFYKLLKMSIDDQYKYLMLLNILFDQGNQKVSSS